MLRRLSATTSRLSRVSRCQPNALAVRESRRHLEPMSVWYLASWCCLWYYAFYFWMPLLLTDMIIPSIVYNKLPTIHFIQEKRAEQKLRRMMDETYTQWSTELDEVHITNAIARTF